MHQIVDGLSRSSTISFPQAPLFHPLLALFIFVVLCEGKDPSKICRIPLGPTNGDVFVSILPYFTIPVWGTQSYTSLTHAFDPCYTLRASYPSEHVKEGRVRIRVVSGLKEIRATRSLLDTPVLREGYSTTSWSTWAGEKHDRLYFFTHSDFGPRRPVRGVIDQDSCRLIWFKSVRSIRNTIPVYHRQSATYHHWDLPYYACFTHF